MKHEFKKGDYVVVKKRLTSISLEEKRKKIGKILRIKKVHKRNCYDSNKTFKFIYGLDRFNWCKEELRKATKQEIKEYMIDEL